MVIYENCCVDCSEPCFDSQCAYQNVKIFVCDACGEKLIDGYYEDSEGGMFCEDCCLEQCFREFSEYEE